MPMVNTLRITSVAAVVLAALVLASVLGPRSLVNLGMKGDAKLDRILQDPNVVDRSRESLTNKAPGGADQIPMLVKQAQDFAKILNPVRSDSTRPTGPAVRTDRPVTPVASSAKFTLVGLSYSALRPEESFAYIRLADSTFQWVRKGEEIGHMTIREIRRGSILCWDGSRESEMMIVAPPDTASLLETVAGTPGSRENAGVSDKPRPGAPATLNQGNDEALNRIADQVKQFQKAARGGDPNDMFPDRAAIMSQMVSELRASEPNAQEAPKPRNPGPKPNASRGAKPSLRQPGFRPPLTSPPQSRAS